MAKKVMATHKHQSPTLSGNGRFVEVIELRRVEVMAEAGGYAMVRRPGCAPYVASLKDIEKDHP
jgi:hypothetical protein